MMRKATDRRRGSAMVEFAISAVLLMAVFTGTFQFGYTFYVYNRLIMGVRTATRYASQKSLTNNNNTTVPSSFSTDVKNMAVYGTTSPSAGTAPIAPGLSTSHVEVSVTFTGAGTPQNRPSTVRVRIVTYQVNAVFRTFTFTNRPSLTMPYFGSYCSEAVTCS
jgi:Flp pilus assembly protein TadG